LGSCLPSAGAYQSRLHFCNSLFYCMSLHFLYRLLIVKLLTSDAEFS
jgi:hypothetical protein